MEFEYTKRYTVFDEPLPLTDLKTDNFYATNSIGIAGTSSSYELYVQGDANITGILSAANVVIDYVDAKTATIGIATIGTAGITTISVGILTASSIGIGTTSVSGIGSTSTVFGVLGDTTVTGYQYRGSRIKTASLTIRGSGYNQLNINRFVTLNGNVLYDGFGRGLALTIIGAGLTHISTINYDTFASNIDSDNLATAISGISTGQIGVLSSCDAWELNITDNLRLAAKRVGLSKLGNFVIPGAGDYRRPYAAVFYGVGSNLNSSPHDVIERMESTDSKAPYASIFCTLASDELSVSISGANSTNALYAANSNIEEPAAIVNTFGAVTTSYQPFITGSLTNTLGSGIANAFTVYQQDPGSLIVVGADRLTATVGGVYLITFNTICDSSFSRFDTQILVNGGVIAQGLNDPQSTIYGLAGYHYRSHSICYRLSVNDFIQFSNGDWHDATSSNDRWKTFSVYLLG